MITTESQHTGSRERGVDVGQVRRRSGNWQGTIRGPDGQERTKTFARRVDADAWVTTTEADLFRGAWVDPQLGRVTLKDYGERWRAVQVHRPTTAVRVEMTLRRHIYPHLGARTLGTLRPSELQAWVKALSATLAPTTVEVATKYLRGILRAAVADGVIARNPATGIKLPRKDRAQVVPLPTAQVLALIDAVPDRYRALIVLAAGTGLRQGECFGLTLPRLDLLRRTLRVEEQLQLLPGAPPYLAPPKTDASYRTVPLPQVVVDAVAFHLASFGTGEMDLIFTSEQGSGIRRTWFSENVWLPAIKARRLPAGTHFHELRHFYASLLIHAGESVKVIQSRLGHAKASETLDTYGHLWPDTEDQTRQAVDGVLGATVARAEAIP
jgi:integrase